MTIYIEDFLIQNIIINICLLRLVFLTSKTKTSTFRLVLSSVVGAGFSVVSAIYIDNPTIINTIKFICAILMIVTCFGFNLKYTMFNMILLFIFTYAFGGAILSLSNSTSKTNFGIFVLPKVNLYLITGILIGITYIFELVLKQIKSKISTGKFIYEITLYFNDKKLRTNAYLDSGNLMKIDGLPAMVLDLKTYLKLTKKNIVDFYISNNKKIKTNTITSNKNLTYITIQKVEILKGKNVLILENQPAIVSTNSTFKNENYKALLSPLMLS